MVDPTPFSESSALDRSSGRVVCPAQGPPCTSQAPHLSSRTRPQPLRSKGFRHTNRGSSPAQAPTTTSVQAPLHPPYQRGGPPLHPGCTAPQAPPPYRVIGSPLSSTHHAIPGPAPSPPPYRGGGRPGGRRCPNIGSGCGWQPGWWAPVGREAGPVGGQRVRRRGRCCRRPPGGQALQPPACAPLGAGCSAVAADSAGG